MIYHAPPLSEEDYLFIEDLGKEHMRAGLHESATRLLRIALQWKYAPVVEFRCDVDESGGLAEVVELENYSKTVPSA